MSTISLSRACAERLGDEFDMQPGRVEYIRTLLDEVIEPALKEKDATIERLQDELSRAKAAVKWAIANSG